MGPVNIATSAVLVLFGCTMLLGQASGGRVLLVVPGIHSHLNKVTSIGKALVDAGHEVYLLAPEGVDVKTYSSDRGINTVRYNPGYEVGMWRGAGADEVAKLHFSRRIPIHVELVLTYNIFTDSCVSIMKDSEAMVRLADLKFDFAILDGMPSSMCMAALPYKLGIPFGVVLIGMTTLTSGVPLPPSFVPSNAFGLSHEMTFIERISNTAVFALDNIGQALVLWKQSWIVSEFVPEKPYISLIELYRKASLLLYDTHVAIDYPRPSLPHVIPMGGMITRPAKPLPEGLESFIRNSREGVILVSFGSVSTVVPEHIVDKILEVFSRLKQTVIWRYNGPIIPNMPSNVIPMKWLPQNDILGQPNVRLFVTHCGNNGQFEAVYHGVPMVGLPIFGDQFANSNRMVYKGFGLQSSMHTFTAEELIEKIQTVWNNRTYIENIRKASEILRSDHMTAIQRVVYWIGHVMQYGDAHLRSYALEMPLYQFFMIDIMLVVLIPFCVLYFILVWMCKYMCRRKMEKKHPTKTKTN